MPYTVWICSGCGEEFDDVNDLDAHRKAVMAGDIPMHAVNSHTDTRYNTVHHDAETREEHVCKVCGHVKED